MKTRVFLLAASLTLSLPAFAQTAPLGQFAQVPPLDVVGSEAIVGLAPLNSQLALVTTKAWYVSPLAPTAGSFSLGDVLQQYGFAGTPLTQVTGNPTNSSEIWITGSGGVGYPNMLLRLDLPPLPQAPSSYRSVLSLAGVPHSLASDGMNAYTVCNGDVQRVTAASGAVTGNMGITTALAVALGSDGKLYVLDSGSNGRILVVDPTSLQSTGTIYLTRPATGPMAISSLGQVFVLVTDSSGALAIDTYEPSTGTLLGSTSGAETFSADQNINQGGHAAMLANNGYLYLVTGTGKFVWEFSTGPRTPGALSCHGQIISDYAHQYGSTAKAAAALGYPSVAALQTAIRVSCGI